jgi:hypothetical protein
MGTQRKPKPKGNQIMKLRLTLLSALVLVGGFAAGQSQAKDYYVVGGVVVSSEFHHMLTKDCRLRQQFFNQREDKCRDKEIKITVKKKVKRPRPPTAAFVEKVSDDLVLRRLRGAGPEGYTSKGDGPGSSSAPSEPSSSPSPNGRGGKI